MRSTGSVMAGTLGRDLVRLHFLRPRTVLVQHALDLALFEVRVGVLVDAHDRRQPAATQAPHWFHRKLHIGRGPARPHASLRLRAFVHERAATHVAGCTQAYLDQVLAAWFQAETAV